MDNLLDIILIWEQTWELLNWEYNKGKYNLG